MKAATRWETVRGTWAAYLARIDRTVLHAVLALAGLALIFELPFLLHASAKSVRAMRAPGDVLALFTFYAAMHAAGWRRTAKAVTLTGAIVLFVFNTDRALFSMIMREEPLLYDQIFMLKHLWVLIGDLWNLRTALVVALACVTLVLIVFVTRWLLRIALTLLEPPYAARLMRALVLSWVAAFVLSGSDVVGASNKPLARWSMLDFTDNARRSAAIARAVKRGLQTSPYLGYGEVRLTRKPDVYIYVVESYGRMLWERPELHKRHDAKLRELEQRLAQAGMVTASGFSTSSVRGARSWLADGTLITGIATPYEAVLKHVLDEIDSHPTMVSFFRSQGYKTFLVSPADRPRPGVEMKNFYNYDQYINFATVKYRGPHYGWGIVPDQYTMGFVRDNVLGRTPEPHFMNFHLVASHSPWAPQPPIANRWRALDDRSGKALRVNRSDVNKILGRLNTFNHAGADVLFMANSKETVNAYVRSIEHDLQLLTYEMSRPSERDRIFILIGDHQPPLLASLEGSYDTPMHVIANRPDLLAEFHERGFRPGLRIGRERDPVTTHAGIFSLIVRALSGCCGDSSSAPTFLRNGQQLQIGPVGRHH